MAGYQQGIILAAGKSRRASNVPLKVQQDIMGHASPEMSLLYSEAELTYRRSAVKLLGETVFGAHNENLMDANGRELGAETPPVALTN